MTLEQAFDLARDLKYGPYVLPHDPVPSLDEAIMEVAEAVHSAPFNWITGQEALRVLREEQALRWKEGR